MEERTSGAALDYLIASRLRGVIAAAEERGKR
jgi:hypothetical protein